MLDRDLAELYQIKPIRLREQVKRNIDRFPLHFMFQLSVSEVDDMVSQNAIPSLKHLGGYLPYAFTEHGILMLANVIRSDVAIKVSIRIIEIFVRLREMSQTYCELLQKLNEVETRVDNHDEEIAIVFEYLKQFEDARRLESELRNRPRIGFKPTPE